MRRLQQRKRELLSVIRMIREDLENLRNSDYLSSFIADRPEATPALVKTGKTKKSGRG